MTEDTITESLIDEVCERLSRDKAVKRSLPGSGVLSIDRELPFLCLYRRDPATEDAGTSSFASHEAAFLSAPGDRPARQGLDLLIRRIAVQAARRFGAFLILEIRSAPDSEVRFSKDPATGEQTPPPPGFRLHAMAESHCSETVNALRFALEGVRLQREPARVDVRMDSKVKPPGLRGLMSPQQQQAVNCQLLGLELLPVYRDPATGAVFPKLHEQLRRKVSRALKKTFYAFAVRRTNLRPHHYYAMGRSRLARSVWDVDKRLAAVSTSFDPLLLVTPINAKSCWNEFQESEFRKPPGFRYRPLPFDPFVMKRELMDIPVERVDDPTMSHLLRLTQDELDRQLTMLLDVGTGRFLQGSQQVYGSVERPLLEQARSLLEITAAAEAEQDGERVGPAAFARRAEQDLDRYRRLDPSFEAVVELREDMYSGLMVSGGRLLVGQGTSIAPDRVDALLAHEVGTHLVTRHNGAQQPMTLLQSGLAGYDSLQEGLAVFAEHLVGGLSPGRLRLLAARVLAADAVIRGAPFADTFSLLVDGCGMTQASAFTIALRVYRGGGLTKDAAYLRGLNQLLEHLRSASDLEVLFAGKMAVAHLPLVRELLLRGVLRRPAVMPSFFTDESAAAVFAEARTFQSALDLARRLIG